MLMVSMSEFTPWAEKHSIILSSTNLAFFSCSSLFKITEINTAPIVTPIINSNKPNAVIPLIKLMKDELESLFTNAYAIGNTTKKGKVQNIQDIVDIKGWKKF